MEEREIIKQIDLHYGKSYPSLNLNNYVEFYFHACFYELFNVEDSDWETEFDGTEIVEFLRALNINIDKEYLISKYKDRNNHNVEIFHSENDEQVFAYFDLKKEADDQNDMFFFGIRCLKQDDMKIAIDLLQIYRKLQTSSAFSFIFYGGQLYYKTFRSYAYFYEKNYTDSKRQIIHHNYPIN